MDMHITWSDSNSTIKFTVLRLEGVGNWGGGGIKYLFLQKHVCIYPARDKFITHLKFPLF